MASAMRAMRAYPIRRSAGSGHDADLRLRIRMGRSIRVGAVRIGGNTRCRAHGQCNARYACISRSAVCGQRARCRSGAEYPDGAFDSGRGVPPPERVLGWARGAHVAKGLHVATNATALGVLDGF